MVVGPGQPAGLSVRISGTRLNGKRSAEGLSLGEGRALRDKRLLVDAVVRNDSPQTDQVACTVTLSGGPDRGRWTERRELDEGETTRFSFTIEFV